MGRIMPDKSKRWVAVLKTLHQSDKLNRCSEGAELLYRRLLEVCDDGGNYYAEPGLLLGYVFAHRMSKGLTLEAVKSRLDELIAVGLVSIYDGGLLHISNYYTRLRADGHGTDVRFTPPGSISSPVPESDRIPTGARSVSTDSDSDKTRQDLDKRTGATGPEPVTPPVRKGRKFSDEERAAVRGAVQAFAVIYHEVNGAWPSWYAPDSRRWPEPKIANAALWFHGLPPDKSRSTLRAVLAGEFYATPPANLAEFRVMFDRLTDANRKGQKQQAKPVASKYDQYRSNP
jgi:hypothetical protein